MNWSLDLSSPIALRDDRVLRTLADASTILIELSAGREVHPWNQYAAQLLLRAANSGDAADVEAVTAQLHRALASEGML